MILIVVLVLLSDEGIESASSSHEDKNCDNCKKQLLGLIYSIGAA